MTGTIRYAGRYRIYRHVPGGMIGEEIVRCRSRKEAKRLAREAFGKAGRADLLGR